MKKILTCLALLYGSSLSLTTTLVAQPVITSSYTLQPSGTIDTIYAASATVAPGAGGANITWNLSALSFSMGGTATIVTSSTSPYISTFPTSNFCLKLTAGGTAYDYDRLSSAGWETISTSYAGPGTGQNYSPNTRLEMPFPFHYLDAVVDTYQLTTGSPATETLTYDGYGTLVTPYHTYSNVFRVKQDFGGSDYNYSWYTVNPLMLVMIYSNSGSNYTYLDVAPNVTQVGSINLNEEQAIIYPNPFSEHTILKITCPSGCNNGTVIITDVRGMIVKQIAVTNTETIIPREGLSAGLYFYDVQNNGSRIGQGQLIIK